MRRYTLIFLIYVFLLPVSILTIWGANPVVAAQSRSATYFSSGQAVYDPQDTAKCQQQAIQDLMVQGLTQAIGSFLTPAQMGTQFAELQKKILAKPAKYIDSYQVFSEQQTGGMYRVVGEVTVSMGTLKEDLEVLGILAAQQTAPDKSASSSGSSVPRGATESEKTQVEKDDEAAAGPDESQASASHPPVVAGGAGIASYRGISATKREILWAVAEKWDQEWVLATESGGVNSLFARNLGKVMGDNDFSILFPQPGSVKMDLSGNIPPSQVISLAEGLGIHDVVVGKVSYAEDRNSKQVLLDADLRVIRIGQGKSEFELHKAQNMEDLSNQEGALELARRIAPQLSNFLGGPPQAGQGTGSSTPAGATSAQVASVGPLLIYVPSAQYPYWMELASILREQFKDMQIANLQIGTTQSAVKLDGVNGEYILKMSGARLPSGATVRIDSYSTEAQTMNVSFSPPGGVQVETK
ncbi:exported hypothetical protein [Syntrophobacter sp. SbD2]|nr:exported hypothetical protein [Syntrophobacter sp. SbD2]